MLHNKDLALLGSRYSRGFELLAACFALGGGGGGGGLICGGSRSALA
jgi:hypothetical protein